MPTETRTFIGGGTGYPFDGWAGFRIGQRYVLHVERSNDNVSIMLDYHEHVTPGAGLVMTEEQFELWFVKG